MTRTFSRRLLSCALISGTVLLTPAWAQTATAQVGKPLGQVSTKSAKSTHRVRHTTAAASAVEAESSLNADDARYLLDRTGFQADESQVRSWVGLSREQAVDRLLAGALTEAQTPPPDWVNTPWVTREVRKSWSDEQRRDEQRLRGVHYDELRAWWVREMLTTPSPLTERMTLFWHNHFTSGQDKVPEPQTMYQQNVLLRRYALGNFGEMLHAEAKDPAMLLYLDGANSRKGRPNENFAREVMELFTLGEGHYTEDDIKQAARAYTGWSVDPDTGAYIWRAAFHDDADKTAFGQSGKFDGDQMLDILLAQPETATFVVTKLWREFVSASPDPREIEPIAEAFRSSHYDIKVALRGLFLSPAFWDPDNRGTLVKSPAEFVVGTVRQFDIGYDSTQPMVGAMRQLGQVLFAPPNVKGWPGGDVWIDSSTLLARKQYVEQLMRSTGDTRGMAMKAAAAASAAAAHSMVSAQAAPKPGAGRGAIRFDLNAWLAQFDLMPDEQPSLSRELQMQNVVLPISPVDPIVEGASSSAYLQALMMDPAYQLK